ncbi:MAG: hypothetical protein MJ184_12435 [Treponema sp.]|uniref:hypothetical protein n=1 Tax=Treponema sp. TaxID=166 RepID=UPI00298DFB50|nr:hypothetical protein [Treponema sp.]MCQ2585522.1 hypothetical protein [Treponema sp.]MCQ2602160.1 hypothetical protein [Treponema sp.]
MGENTLTVNTLDLVKSASKELDKAYEKITLLQAVVSDKKKAKKIKKSAELLEAANLAIKSLEITLK